jgi:hypothetical protein
MVEIGYRISVNQLNLVILKDRLKTNGTLSTGQKFVVTAPQKGLQNFCINLL